MGSGLLPNKFWAADGKGNREGVEFAFMRLTDLQTFRLTELQTYRVTELQSCRFTDLQSYRVTELQNYKLTGARLRMKK